MPRISNWASAWTIQVRALSLQKVGSFTATALTFDSVISVFWCLKYGAGRVDWLPARVNPGGFRVNDKKGKGRSITGLLEIRVNTQIEIAKKNQARNIGPK